jgi:adenosylhomocysteinase
VTLPPSDVADLGLADAGRHRIEYAERAMPVLGLLRDRFARERPLDGVRVALCAHVTPETASLVRTLAAGGAELRLAASNPLSTQDDVAAALVVDDGVGVHARHAVGRDGFAAHLAGALDGSPQLLLDDGCDLVSLLHTTRTDLLPGLLAGGEQTATGVLRLRQMAADGALRLPMVALNDTPMQLLVANRHGTGQSTLDAVMRATGRLLAGSCVVVAGYGWCGSGIAARARGMGARVLVTEVQADRALEAVLDGHQVLPMIEAAALGDVFLTTTGNRDVLTSEHYAVMRDGAVLANAGHFDVEVDVDGLASSAVSVARGVRPQVDAYELEDGRRLLLVAEGRLVNLAAAEGHPAAVMDISFAVQALTVQWLATAELSEGVHAVPAAIDDEVARTKLSALGVELDRLTPAQDRYLSSWRGASG